MKALDVDGVARPGHTVATVDGGVLGMGVGEGIGHLEVGFQHPDTPIRLQTAHRCDECTAGKPVARGKWMPIGINGGILNNGWTTKWTAHCHTETCVRITADQTTNGGGVSRRSR